MRKPEFLCMKKMAVEVSYARAQACILDCIIASAAIGFVADDRMLQPRKVNANLVSPARFQFHIQQREPLEGTPHSIKRQSVAASTHDGHARTIRRIARKRLIDSSGSLKHASVDQRNV